jgi:UDP-N-acetylglucosamine:LPS N-acetylglucosamine transferase
VQLQRLSLAFEGLDVAFVSVRAGYANDVPGHRFYTVQDATRRDRWKLLKLIGQLARILLVERPDVVVSTGAAPGIIALALAKYLLRSKTIWIDSIANCEKMSSSGLQARRVADVWLTQWPQLHASDGPSYWGAVL